MPEFRIDPEFRGLLRELTDEERGLLESQLLEDGCLSPLVVWEEEGILLDGHHRFDICEREGIPCKVARISFGSREEAKEWVQRTQRGRRNIPPAKESYERGKEYQKAKGQRGRPKKAEESPGEKRAQAAPFSGRPGKTADKLAEKHGVDPATIKRDAEFAKAVDAAPPEVKDAVLNGRLPKTAVLNQPAEPGAVNRDVDGWGIPIQPHAAEAFEAVPLFDELLTLLRKADRLYSKIAGLPGGAYLLRPGISVNSRERYLHKGIKDALLAVHDCKPTYTVCPRAYHLAAFPDCQDKTPHGPNCNLCHGLNWTRPLTKQETHPECVAKAKEAFGVGD